MAYISTREAAQLIRPVISFHGLRHSFHVLNPGLSSLQSSIEFTEGEDEEGKGDRCVCLPDFLKGTWKIFFI